MEHRGQKELDGDLLIELYVMRGHDDAHAAYAKHPLNAVLAGEDLALPHSRCFLGIPLHHGPTGNGAWPEPVWVPA
jgi:hypothetical protein